MGYDKERLKRWSEDECWGDYLIRKQALDGSRERFKACEEKYFNVLRKRISFCENILKRNEDAFVNYTLAQLHDKDDVDRSSETLYKRKVIDYCEKALRLDPQFVPAWILLAKSYEWIATVGDSDAITHPSIPAIEKAINCIKRASTLDPLKEKYQEMLKGYYHQRNEEYRR